MGGPEAGQLAQDARAQATRFLLALLARAQESPVLKCGQGRNDLGFDTELRTVNGYGVRNQLSDVLRLMCDTKLAGGLDARRDAHGQQRHSKQDHQPVGQAGTGGVAVPSKVHILNIGWKPPELRSGERPRRTRQLRPASVLTGSARRGDRVFDR
ncbi:hypothetical protein [uncultured Jatrophihabitans sp.]|uniref:hypothetical protein n=1 Tax=uncultured Jatrophihabitans sp. TaxID=1610747 RepID=UPI0035CACEA9